MSDAMGVWDYVISGVLAVGWAAWVLWKLRQADRLRSFWLNEVERQTLYDEFMEARRHRMW